MERAVVRVVLDKLSELLTDYPLTESYRSFRDLAKNLETLRSVISSVSGSLEAAEKMYMTIDDPSLLDWLAKLKDAAFDTEDILDADAFDSLRLKRSTMPRFIGRIFSSSTLGSEISKLLERFEEFKKERTKFHLDFASPAASTVEDEFRQTHSTLPCSTLVGREVDTKKVVDILLRGDFDAEPGVVSIVGMGGLGKTTLAKMVFADEEINSRFPTRIWASVYGDFKLERIAGKILEAMGRIPGSSVEAAARSELAGKRFLLVLDDVWEDIVKNWDEVRDFLRCGARGSRVLVTTRSKNMAMPWYVHQLAGMSEDECWCLFRERAFSSAVGETEELIAIGKEISKKSKGLPLVANVLGGLMQGKTRRRQWEEVRDNEIWDVLPDHPEDEQDILPALRLSYSHLDPTSKPCFAYCAVFRKGHRFDREKLIQYWVSNGLIKKRGERRLEDIGGEIFDNLLARCLLELKERNNYWETPVITMHDMIHDLARFVAKNECHIVTGGRSDDHHNNNQMIRFLSIYVDPSVDIHKATVTAPKLRTLLTLSPLPGESSDDKVLLLKNEQRFLSDVLKKFKLLRVLDLHLGWIDMVPVEIGNLKHLRYLNLSCRRIKSLPDSVCSLLNLRTLRLGRCLIALLPDDLKRLSNLCYLDIQKCRLFHMPPSIGQLTNLQVLTTFVVSKERGSSSLSELQGLDLRGELSIMNLENVKDHRHATNAELYKKEHLEYLYLYWTKGGSSHCNRRADASNVLNALRPNHNLCKIRLSNYCGMRLPSWIADPSSKLVSIELWYCQKLDKLHAFGQLRFLTYLQLIGLDSVKNIGEEFYGFGDTSDRFPALKELAFSDMLNFESWWGVQGRDFPVLNTLTLKNCPELNHMPNIPNLQRIEIWNCKSTLLESVANMQSLSSVLLKVRKTKSLPEGSFLNLPSVKKLRLEDCLELASLPSMVIQLLSSLEELIITGCIDLVRIPDSICKLSLLKKLEIAYGVNMSTLPHRLCSMHSLKSVRIVGCFNISWEEVGIQSVCALPEFHVEICSERTDLSGWLCYAENLLELQILGIHEKKRKPDDLVCDRFLRVCCCGDLEALPEELSIASSLEELSIHGCDALSHLSESLENLRELRYLYIYDCVNLMAFCNGLQVQPRELQLRVLVIKGCPELEKKCQDDSGECWNFISQIPEVEIGMTSIEFGKRKENR